MDFTQFDFEKFKSLCNEGNSGYLDLRNGDVYRGFIKYLEDNDIAYENELGDTVWFDFDYCGVRGTYIYSHTAEIYTFEDFIPALPFNTTDVLDFLEV